MPSKADTITCCGGATMLSKMRSLRSWSSVGDEEGCGHIPAQRLPVVRAAQLLEETGNGSPNPRRQDDGGGKLWIADGEIEGHSTAHAVPDQHRLCELKPLAHPCQIVGEDLHRVVLARLVASAVPT